MERIPFSPEELRVSDHYLPLRPGMPAPAKLLSPVTPRENYLAFLRGEKPHWLPAHWDRKIFNPRILPDYVARGMVFDGKPFNGEKDAGGMDSFGVTWTYEPKVRGSVILPGTELVKDINHWEDDVTLPDLDALDWVGCAQEHSALINDGRMTQMTITSGLFERLASFVGMTEALIDLVDEDTQPGIHRLFDYLCGYYDDLMGRMKKWFHCDVVCFQDDWGSQRAPLFSASVCREMIAPYLKRIIDSAHKHGLFFEMHSCGKNELMVPIMIECGVDLWHGQEMNDKVALYKQYGDKIKLGVAYSSPCQLAPGEKMTEDESLAAFRTLLETYSNCNVYIGTFASPESHPNAQLHLYEESRKAYLNL